MQIPSQSPSPPPNDMVCKTPLLLDPVARRPQIRSPKVLWKERNQKQKADRSLICRSIPVDQEEPMAESRKITHRNTRNAPSCQAQSSPAPFDENAGTELAEGEVKRQETVYIDIDKKLRKSGSEVGKIGKRERREEERRKNDMVQAIGQTAG